MRPGYPPRQTPAVIVVTALIGASILGDVSTLSVRCIVDDVDAAIREAKLGE